MNDPWYVVQRAASRLERMRAMLDAPPAGQAMLDLLMELDRLGLDLAELDAGTAGTPRTVAAMCSELMRQARALFGLTQAWPRHVPDADAVESARRLAAGVTRCAGALASLVEVTHGE